MCGGRLSCGATRRREQRRAHRDRPRRRGARGRRHLGTLLRFRRRGRRRACRRLLGLSAAVTVNQRIDHPPNATARTLHPCRRRTCTHAVAAGCMDRHGCCRCRHSGGAPWSASSGKRRPQRARNDGFDKGALPGAVPAGTRRGACRTGRGRGAAASTPRRATCGCCRGGAGRRPMGWLSRGVGDVMSDPALGPLRDD